MIGSISSLGGATQQVEIARSNEDIQGFEDIFNNAAATQDEEELKEACMQIEHYFLSSIMKQMVSTIRSEDSLIPKGDYENMVEDYLIDEQCKMICESGGIGLGDMMYNQMLREL